MRFSCPNCNQPMEIADQFAGRKGSCPKCGHRITVPTLRANDGSNSSLSGKPEAAPMAGKSPPQKKEPIDDLSDLVEGSLIPEVIPVHEIAKVNPVTEKSDPKQSFDIDEHNPMCVLCQYPLRFRNSDRGKILRCPQCLYYFKAPGRRRRGEPDGLPVPVTLSAERIIWPVCCACCLGIASDFLKASAKKVDSNDLASAAWAMHYNNYGYALIKALNSTETRWWKIPYCLECIDHITHVTDEADENCCCVDAAVRFDGWHGAIQRFSFFNWKYANQFMLANHEKRLI